MEEKTYYTLFLPFTEIEPLVKMNHFRHVVVDELTVYAIQSGKMTGSFKLLGASVYVISGRLEWKGVIHKPDLKQVMIEGYKAGFPWIRVQHLVAHHEGEELVFERHRETDVETGQLVSSPFRDILTKLKAEYDLPKRAKTRYLPWESLDLKGVYDIDDVKRIKEIIPNSLSRICRYHLETEAGREKWRLLECKLGL